MRFFYSLSIYAYLFAIRIASLFNSKAKLWLNGRKNVFEDLRHKIIDSRLKTKDSRLIWVHCASLGEFEQGRPLIERLKYQYPDLKILLTFFSPSGYEIRKNYSGADFVFYLPLDTPSNAKKFIGIIKPQWVFFVKYEFWFNYLNELKNQNIPTYLVSGIFRENQYFFKSTGAWSRKQLTAFTYFFLQNKKSVELLNSIGYNNTILTGDTRFDRVIEITNNVKQVDFVNQFADGKKVLIVGSSWSEDEKIVANFFSINQQLTTNYKIIIAPHEVDEKHIASIEAQFTGAIRYSKANEKNSKEAQVLIIDNIGMLSSLYQYGTIAFIGGGFGKGIHNILEAATFGLPVIFGPNYQKFTEAKELIELGAALSIKDFDSFEKTMVLLNDDDALKNASHVSKAYVQSRAGATDKIIAVVMK